MGAAKAPVGALTHARVRDALVEIRIEARRVVELRRGVGNPMVENLEPRLRARGARVEAQLRAWKVRDRGARDADLRAARGIARGLPLALRLGEWIAACRSEIAVDSDVRRDSDDDERPGLVRAARHGPRERYARRREDIRLAVLLRHAGERHYDRNEDRADANRGVHAPAFGSRLATPSASPSCTA